MGYCYIDSHSYEQCYSSWILWGRWLLLAIAVGIALIFVLVSFITARRRRKAGFKPYLGTAWTLGFTPPGHAPPEYSPNQPSNKDRAPPAYNAAQPSDVELQQPQSLRKGQQ